MMLKQTRTPNCRRFGWALCFLVGCLITAPEPACGQSQWTTNGNNINNTNSGNVGVGTASPGNKLDIAPSQGDGLRIRSTGQDTNTSDVSITNTGISVSTSGWTAPNTFLATFGNPSSQSAGDSAGVLMTVSHTLDNNTNSLLKLFNRNQTGFTQTGYFLRATGNAEADKFWVKAGGSAFFAGNVGMGSTNPTSKLHLVSGTDSATTFLHLDTGIHGGTAFAVGGTVNNESTLDLSVYRGGQYYSRFGVNSFGHVYLQPSQSTFGNVGIGTTNPSAQLHISNTLNSNTNPRLLVDGSFTNPAASSNDVYFRANLDNNANHTLLRLEHNNPAGNTPNGYLLKAVADGGASGFDAFTLNATGIAYFGANVGIGTASPTTTLHVVGDVTVTGNIAAKYQDIAEWVPTQQQLTAGTVVVLDPEHSNHVISSTVAYDTRVAGVISERPGLTLGENAPGKTLVATTGRVRVKVSASGGAIKIGDLLVTSDVTGVAMKSEPVAIGRRLMHMRTLIGKALEPLEKGTREILVLLSLQ